MGLLDELERNGNRRRSSPRQRIWRYYQMPDGRVITPRQYGRERKQQNREVAGVIVGIIGWIPTFVTLGTYWLILTIPLGALFTVLALSIGFSTNDREVKRHSRWAWREYKSYVLALFGRKK